MFEKLLVNVDKAVRKPFLPEFAMEVDPMIVLEVLIIDFSFRISCIKSKVDGIPSSLGVVCGAPLC